MEAASDRTIVRTHDNVGVGFATAGIGSRFLALLIDTVIFAPIGIAVFYGVVALLSLVWPESSNNGAVDSALNLTFQSMAASLSMLVAYLLYFAISEGLFSGRTLGKTALGLRVVRTDGSSIGMGEAVLRSITKPLLLIDFTFGVVVMFFQPQSRRIGDLLAGTMVVRERSPAHNISQIAPLPVFLHLHDPGPPISGVERLGSREMSALRMLLSRPDLHPVQRQRVALEMAHKLLLRLELPADAPERSEAPELLIERIYLQLAQQPQ